ncbi:MAG: metallophosphoesterase [Planctomycetes bacterium]|nr:metallophosphoesterase [Planctomycetota bacterium]
MAFGQPKDSVASQPILISMTTLAFIGDVHGRWARLGAILALPEVQSADAVLQVGDFGFWPQTMPRLKPEHISRPFFAIDGNHEHFPWLAQNKDKLPHGITFLERASTLEVGPLTIGLLGGAASIDKAMRKAGHDWFPEEEISRAEFESIRPQMAGLDLMVSHDAPNGLRGGYWHDIEVRPHPASLKQRHMLTQLWESASPKLWVHGHHHHAHSQMLGRTLVIGLDHVHPSEGIAGGFSVVRLDADGLEVLAGVGSQ